MIYYQLFTDKKLVMERFLLALSDEVAKVEICNKLKRLAVKISSRSGKKNI